MLQCTTPARYCLLTHLHNLQVCIEIFDLYNAGKLKEAEAKQLKLAQMEWGFAKGGINGTKWVVAKYHGYAMQKCHCRRPYPQYSDAQKQDWIFNIVAPLLEDEKRMAKL